MILFYLFYYHTLIIKALSSNPYIRKKNREIFDLIYIEKRYKIHYRNIATRNKNNKITDGVNDCTFMNYFFFFFNIIPFLLNCANPRWTLSKYFHSTNTFFQKKIKINTNLFFLHTFYTKLSRNKLKPPIWLLF